MSKKGAPRKRKTTGRYKAEPKEYTLLFDEEGDPHEGLQVVMDDPLIDDLISMMSMADAISEQGESAAKDVLLGFFGKFAAHLLEWNVVDDDDQEVPADLAGVRARPLSEVMAVFEAWFEAVTGVSGPLDGPSTDGDALAQIPMTSPPGSGG